ncbi:MAG TPA: hypothetical protein VFO79_03055 [Xanthomonadales bacterium]|nr:hypothetical protein [Xanthomonadales bacterium]
MALIRITTMLCATAFAAATAHAEIISVESRDVAGLAAAIERANHGPGLDLIELAPGGLYPIAQPADRERSLALPVVRSRIRIIGNGAEIRGYAETPMQLLHVAESGDLRIDHLTLAEGTRGAIENRGRLELSHVAIVDNSAPGGTAIVANFGTLIARATEISFNQLAGTQRDAGVVLNYGTLRLFDSGLVQNSVSRRFGTLVSASAVLNLGEARLVRVRVLGNAAEDGFERGGGALVALGNGRFDNDALELAGNQPAD